MKKLSAVLVVLTLVFFSLTIFGVALGDTQGTTGAIPNAGVGLKNPLQWNDFNVAFGKLMDQVTVVAAIVAVLAFIWVGWLYVRAMGKPEEIKNAHRAFMYVAIGVAILLGARVLSSIIQNTIGNLK